MGGESEKETQGPRRLPCAKDQPNPLTTESIGNVSIARIAVREDLVVFARIAS